MSHTLSLAGIADALMSLHTQAQTLTHGTLNAPQQAFTQHIANLYQRLAQQLAEAPGSQAAALAVIPALGDPFYQQLTAAYGYARLLLESPASFQGAALPDELVPAATHLYEQGMALAQRWDALRAQAAQARVTARRQPAQSFDAAALIQEMQPIYQFLLAKRPVRVIGDAPPTAPVYARQYHIAELLNHLVLTTASELMEYGTIRLALRDEPRCVALAVECSGLGLTPDEMAVLFEKNGRHVYREQLDVDEGYMTFHREPGVRGTLLVHIPKAKADAG